jgi:hypothetical protein
MRRAILQILGDKEYSFLIHLSFAYPTSISIPFWFILVEVGKEKTRKVKKLKKEIDKGN